MQLFVKILSGMANSEDPDQTAPLGAVWSESALFAYAILLQTLVVKMGNQGGHKLWGSSGDERSRFPPSAFPARLLSHGTDCVMPYFPELLRHYNFLLFLSVFHKLKQVCVQDFRTFTVQISIALR